MDIVTSKESAAAWFIRNSYGTVICERHDGLQMECSSYPEAAEFFESRPVVESIEQTCAACPAQWEGKTKDGRFFYIRYRWGCLQFGIAANIDLAVEQRSDVGVLGNGFDGTLTDEAMRQCLAPLLDFSGLEPNQCH